MRRRWPVVLPIVLLTMLVGLLMVATRTREYTSPATYFLSSEPTEEGDRERLDREPLDPGVVAQLAPALYGSGSARSDVAEAGYAGTYEVAAVGDGPVIRITVDAPTADDAVATVEHLITIGPLLLDQAFDDAARSVAFAAVTPPDVADVTETEEGFQLIATVSISSVSPDRANPFPPNAATLDWLFAVAADPLLERQVQVLDSAGGFSIEQDTRSAAPIFTATVTASSAALVFDIHEVVVERLEDKLRDLQDDAQVVSARRTVVSVLLPPSDPVPTASSVVRTLAGVVVLGGAFAIGGALVADAFAMRRRRGSDDPSDGDVERPAETTERPPPFQPAEDPGVPVTVAADGAAAPNDQVADGDATAPATTPSTTELANAWELRKRAKKTASTSSRRSRSRRAPEREVAQPSGKGSEPEHARAEANGEVGERSPNEPITPP